MSSPLRVKLVASGANRTATELLVTYDRQTPRSGVPVILRDEAGAEVARALSDFDGYALFDALALTTWRAEAAGHRTESVALSREQPDKSLRVLIAPRQ